MVIDGYKVPGTDLEEIEKLLARISGKMQKKADKVYTRLFCKELACCCDRQAILCAQGAPREEKADIYRQAQDIFFTKIENVKKHDLPGRYNFMAGVYIYPYKGDTYLELRLGNEEYRSCMSGLESFGLSEEETTNPDNAKCRIWDGIRRKYTQSRSAAVFFQLLSPPEFKKEYAAFEPKQERARRLAEQDAVESAFSKFTDGQQLPPGVFMSFFTDAMDIASLKSVRENAGKVQEQLEQILQDPASFMEEEKEVLPEEEAGSGEDKAPETGAEKEEK